jgi:hypothetical protein
VSKDDGADRHRPWDAGGGKPGGIVPSGLPGMPDAPETVEHSCCNGDSDEQNEEAVRRVINHAASQFPPG